MKKKRCFILAVLLIAAISIYALTKYMGKPLFNINCNNTIIHAPCYKSVKTYTGVNNESKSVSYNSNNTEKEDSSRQLSISFLKKIDFGKYGFIMGWYGDDSIAATEDIISKDIHIINLNDSTEKVIKADDCIIDYANKKFLVDCAGGFQIFDSSKNTKKYIIADCEQQPRFIDVEGRYVLMDDNKNYYIVEASTGRKMIIDANISDYEAPDKVTGYPTVTISDDYKKFYFTRQNDIRESTFENSSESKKIIDLPSNCENAVYLKNVRYSNIMIVQMNCSDDMNMPYYTLNMDTKKFTKLNNIAFYDAANNNLSVSGQNGVCGKAVYSQKNKQSGLYCLYVGKVKDGEIIKNRELVLDGLPKNFSKDNWTWNASWNENATKIFIYVSAAGDSNFNSAYYASVEE